ncbi:MAG: hypothetical protein AB8I08_36735 [Sandaracinaceae bacterium]
MDGGWRASVRHRLLGGGFRRGDMLFCVAFLGLASLLPLAVGDLYPFTIAPMFAERFQRFCAYRVLAPDGTELELTAFSLQHNHGGNPLGYRGGFEAPATLHPFGVIGSEGDVRRHVRARLATRRETFVTVIQTTVAPLPDGSVGPVEVRRWRVARAGTDDR